MTEYVKLTLEEKKIGEKNFLQSQIELLNILKFLTKFKNFRKQELSLKILLNSKIDEVQHSFSVLDKILPKINLNKNNDNDLLLNDNNTISIDQEVEIIKRKLAGLSS